MSVTVSAGNSPVTSLSLSGTPDHPFVDPHFREDARHQFLQRFWEMYLACALLERGFNLERVGHEGPEFFFLCEGRRVCG